MHAISRNENFSSKGRDEWGRGGEGGDLSWVEEATPFEDDDSKATFSAATFLGSEK